MPNTSNTGNNYPSYTYEDVEEAIYDYLMALTGTNYISSVGATNEIEEMTQYINNFIADLPEKKPKKFDYNKLERFKKIIKNL